MPAQILCTSSRLNLQNVKEQQEAMQQNPITTKLETYPAAGGFVQYNKNFRTGVPIPLFPQQYAQPQPSTVVPKNPFVLENHLHNWLYQPYLQNVRGPKVVLEPSKIVEPPAVDLQLVENAYLSKMMSLIESNRSLTNTPINWKPEAEVPSSFPEERLDGMDKLQLDYEGPTLANLVAEKVMNGATSIEDATL